MLQPKERRNATEEKTRTELQITSTNQNEQNQLKKWKFY